MILIDDTGSHRLTEHQRLMLHILMETEPDASSETGPAGVALLSAIPVGEAATSSTQASSVAEHDGPTNLQSAQAAVAV